MEAAPSLETVFQALQALYHNPDVSGKEKASIWLGELQRSVHAWQVADQLMQLNQDVESCYFAAQTMRTKIQYSFHELPTTSHQSLRDSLMAHADKITEETPAVIATQLCLALADLALQMTAWKQPAQDLIQKFASDPKHFHFLVEVLTVLPEEINSRSLRLGANRRDEITQELCQSASVVVQLLTACVENFAGDLRLQAKVFHCLGSWFTVKAMPQECIVNTKLVMAPFQALLNPECPSYLHEAASDCISSALYAAEDIEKTAQLGLVLFQGVLLLPDAYHMSVAMEDMDKSVNFCRIFTEMGESFLEALVQTPNQGFGDFRTLELLLTCVGHHDYEVADITFNFWYRLSEMLYHQNSDERNKLFQPYVQRLIVALCRHCQFDPDHEGTFDEKSEFNDFRTRVSELTKDVVFIVGSSTCFKQMFDCLRSQSSDASWNTSEAALFIMVAIAKNIRPNEAEIVPQVLMAVLNLPENTHIMLRHTGTHLVGELGEWIENHSDTLDPVLQFLMAGFQHPQLATVAANSLQNICSQSQEQMSGHFPGLLQIVQAMGSFNVSNDAALGLLKGTGQILGKMTPPEKVTEGLRQLCLIQIDPLKNILMKEHAEKPSVGSKDDPTVWLDRLAAIFRHTNPTVTNEGQHPCQPVVHEIWPVLSEACTKYQADIRVIERCCRCIRFAVRCIRKGSADLLTPLVTQMVGLYTVHQHSCFLYLGSILVDEYGADPNCVQGLVTMLQAFCEPTFKILEETNGLRNHPDTVDDLFRLCLRFTKRAPVHFLQSSMVKPLLCCAIAAIGLDHREANASVTRFLTELCKATHEKADREDFSLRSSLARALLEEHGPAITSAILNGCLFHLPSFMVTDLAEVLYELMLVDRPAFCKWLEATLKGLPTESSGGVVTATHKQLVDYHKAVTNPEDLKTVTQATREFTRLYR